MPHLYKAIHDIAIAFDQIVNATSVLHEIYRDTNPTAWSMNSPTPNADWMYQALHDFWYEDGQDGRATRTYVGLVAATPAIIEAAVAVNLSKARFRQLLAELKSQDQSLIADLKHELPLRHPCLLENMRGSGLARLHLKQAWRSLPIAESPVKRVRLSWYSSGRSIRRITVREAEQMLLKMDSDSPHIQIQLQALAGIPSGEPLAQVQAQAPVMRANLFFQDIAESNRERRALNVAMPLFIPSEDGQLPDYNIPPPFPPTERTRKIRTDEQLEPEPFLRSLRIYRYKAQESGSNLASKLICSPD